MCTKKVVRNHRAAASYHRSPFSRRLQTLSFSKFITYLSYANDNDNIMCCIQFALCCLGNARANDEEKKYTSGSLADALPSGEVATSLSLNVQSRLSSPFERFFRTFQLHAMPDVTLHVTATVAIYLNVSHILQNRLSMGHLPTGDVSSRDG